VSLRALAEAAGEAAGATRFRGQLQTCCSLQTLPASIISRHYEVLAERDKIKRLTMQRRRKEYFENKAA
jgi:hypothetical protein